MKTLESEHDVLIVGGGPTGLTLAAELALAGVDVAILEKRVDQSIAGARAGGLHPRTLEVFDQRGIVDRFVGQGQKYPVVLFPGTTLSTADLQTRHAYWLGLWQENIERTLADWAAQLNVSFQRSVEVTDFEQDDAGVKAMLADGRTVDAA
jgi:2-polyprenyl-6-methoxyphenol hydroxylase-like FAD-dependent oxidoreductase